MLTTTSSTYSREFIHPNDCAKLHGERFCGESRQDVEGSSYPHHCLHGTRDPACCWCGDVFLPDNVHCTNHGDNFHPLTRREVEVVALIAEGLPDRLIAKRLKISAYTAHFHANNIMTKLDVKNRAAAAATAVRKGIIT